MSDQYWLKRLFLAACLILSLHSTALANNLTLTNFGPNGLNTSAKTVKLRFQAAWDNSWRLADGQHDALWMFVKTSLSGVWYHATLLASGVNPTGTAKSPNCPYDIVVPQDRKGFFIRRSESNVGCCTMAPASSCDYFEVTIAFGEDETLYGITLIEISSGIFLGSAFKLFGMEMVYIPQGAFYAGDGASSDITGQFEDGTSGNPKLITSEDALTLGGGSGSLGNNNASGMVVTADDFNDSTAQTLPAVFPKGYNAFYLMKYEITQGQYRDFLNTLTYTQQATRTANAPSSAAGTGALITGNTYRNGLDIKTAGSSGEPVTPAVYGCNLDADANYDEDVDGQWIACNCLSWMDGAAYLDWAGLRPFTELEFEKSARGPLAAVAGEYAWGAATIASSQYTLSSSGTSSERIDANYSTSSGNANYRTTVPGSGTSQGPLRVGIFAAHASNSGRVTAGAGYYGVMELSGNLFERSVTVGNTTGRAFTGAHGNGTLTTNGNADVATWPGLTSGEVTGATGSGFRGGYWTDPATNLRVSDRIGAPYTDTTRQSTYGFRGARTAP